MASCAPADVDGVVAADGARGGGERVGRADDGAALLHDVLALPDHGDDRAGDDCARSGEEAVRGGQRGRRQAWERRTGDGEKRTVVDEAGEERLGGEIGVVGLGELAGDVHQLEGCVGDAEGSLQMRESGSLCTSDAMPILLEAKLNPQTLSARCAAATSEPAARTGGTCGRRLCPLPLAPSYSSVNARGQMQRGGFRAPRASDSTQKVGVRRTHELVAALLEALDDLADEAALDAVRLDLRAAECEAVRDPLGDNTAHMHFTRSPCAEQLVAQRQRRNEPQTTRRRAAQARSGGVLPFMRL